MLHLALSQAEYGHAILQDIGMICVVALVLAGVLHAFLRKSMPGLQWNTLGKVSTAGLSSADILGCLFVTAPYSLSLIMPYKAPSGPMDTLSLCVNFAVMLMIAGAVLFMFKQRNLLPHGMGLKPKHPVQVVSWTVGFYLFFVLLVMLLDRIGLKEWLVARLGEEQQQEIVNEMINADDLGRKVVLILGACVIAPVAEEIIFRGYLYPVVKRYTEPVVAALFTGVVFGAIHGNAWAVILLSLFGVLLAVLYEKSGSLWACILCHAMFNGINTVFMLTQGDKL